MTKTDLRPKTGNILGMALWDVIIASVANLLRSLGLSWIVKLVFTGLVAYDAQKLTVISAYRVYQEGLTKGGAAEE